MLDGEAVTDLDGPRAASTTSFLPTGISDAGTGTAFRHPFARSSPPPSLNAARASVAIVGRGRLGTALSRPCGARDRCLRAAGPRRRPERGRRGAAVRTRRRDRRRRGAGRPRAAGRPLLGRHEPRRARPARAFLAAPADDGDRGGRRRSGSRAPARRSRAARPGRARSPRRLAGALAMRPFELAERDRAAYHAAASIASNFLVTLRGRGRAARARRRRRPRGPRAAGAGDGRELGAARARARADRPGGARRRGDRGRSAGGASRTARRTCCRCSTRSWTRPAAAVARVRRTAR